MNSKEIKCNFKYTEDVIDGNPESEYLILCANINSDDTWVWKFCVHEYNYTPVWSSGYGNCNIKGKDLESAMKSANDWVNGIMEFPQNKSKTEYKMTKDGLRRERLPIELFLMKMK